MFRRGPGRLEMCFYAYKNVLEPMGHLGANLIFFILTLNQVAALASCVFMSDSSVSFFFISRCLVEM